jgi:hypothetical protein
MQESKDTEFYPVVSVICQSPLIHVEVDFKLSLVPLSRHGLTLSQADKKSLNTSISLMSHLPLRRGRREPLTINTATSPQSSSRARRRQSPEPSRTRQPPRVTSRWRLLGVPPNASRITNGCKCTRNTQSLTWMQSQAKSVREWVGGSQLSSMYARNG